MTNVARRALLTGHFSTVGDIEVLREVERQLAAQNIEFEVAPLGEGMYRCDPHWQDIRKLDPSRYTHLFVICGPFHRPYFIRCGVDLDKFAHCTRIGVNLSMIEDVNAYNPFDELIGRDNDNVVRPDVSFLHKVNKRPVAGLCFVSMQREYGARQKLDKAADMLRRLATRNDLAVLETDTEWPAARNAHGIASPEQFESVCARVDVMLTTRLHGTVLSLKNETPVIAIDAIAGGGKVLRQAAQIGWPEAFSIDDVTDATLDAALIRCLDPAARQRARACAESAVVALGSFSAELSRALNVSPKRVPSFTSPTVSTRIQRKVKKLKSGVGKIVRGKRHWSHKLSQ